MPTTDPPAANAQEPRASHSYSAAAASSSSSATSLYRPVHLHHVPGSFILTHDACTFYPDPTPTTEPPTTLPAAIEWKLSDIRKLMANDPSASSKALLRVQFSSEGNREAQTLQFETREAMEASKADLKQRMARGKQDLAEAPTEDIPQQSQPRQSKQTPAQSPTNSNHVPVPPSTSQLTFQQRFHRSLLEELEARIGPPPPPLRQRKAPKSSTRQSQTSWIRNKSVPLTPSSPSTNDQQTDGEKSELFIRALSEANKASGDDGKNIEDIDDPKQQEEEEGEYIDDSEFIDPPTHIQFEPLRHNRSDATHSTLGQGHAADDMDFDDSEETFEEEEDDWQQLPPLPSQTMMNGYAVPLEAAVSYTKRPSPTNEPSLAQLPTNAQSPTQRASTTNSTLSSCSLWTGTTAGVLTLVCCCCLISIAIVLLVYFLVIVPAAVVAKQWTAAAAASTTTTATPYSPGTTRQLVQHWLRGGVPEYY